MIKFEIVIVSCHIWKLFLVDFRCVGPLVNLKKIAFMSNDIDKEQHEPTNS